QSPPCLNPPVGCWPSGWHCTPSGGDDGRRCGPLAGAAQASELSHLVDVVCQSFEGFVGPYQVKLTLVLVAPGGEGDGLGGGEIGDFRCFAHHRREYLLDDSLHPGDEALRADEDLAPTIVQQESVSGANRLRIL